MDKEQWQMQVKWWFCFGEFWGVMIGQVQWKGGRVNDFEGDVFGVFKMNGFYFGEKMEE